jgi:ankyrin repeat protein
MAMERDFRRVIFGWFPALMLLAFVAWCSSSSRGRVDNTALRLELVELFSEQGVIDGQTVRHDDLPRLAKQIGKPGMNRVLAATAPKASLAALQWMLDHGADVKAIEPVADMPVLHRIAARPQFDRFDYFLKLGLDPTQRGRDGETVLHVAAANGIDARALALLLGRGLSLADTTTAGRQPLHGADVASMAVLAAAGADLSARDREGRTPLHLAAFEGRNDAVRELLRLGGSVYSTDQKSRTPLHLAMLRGHTKAADLLVAAGAPAAARDQDGLSPQEMGGAESARKRRHRARTNDEEEGS